MKMGAVNFIQTSSVERLFTTPRYAIVQPLSFDERLALHDSTSPVEGGGAGQRRGNYVTDACSPHTTDSVLFDAIRPRRTQTARDWYRQEARDGHVQCDEAARVRRLKGFAEWSQ